MSSTIDRANLTEASVLRSELNDPGSRPTVEVAHAERSSFDQALGSLGSEIDSGEKLVRGALVPEHGRLGPGDLIALQAGIYRYSEAVDLATKLVDRAGSAVRTTLQGSG
jgi:hypothetical protein